MSKFAMDLSKFKTVKQDQKTTTLQHPAGHTITVMHGALSPKMRNLLPKSSEDLGEPKKMADGGQISQDRGPRIDPKKAKEIQDGANQSGWQPDTWKKNLKAAVGLADGGEVEQSPAMSSYDPSMAEGIGKAVGAAFKSAAQSAGEKVKAVGEIASHAVQPIKDAAHGFSNAISDEQEAPQAAQRPQQAPVDPAFQQAQQNLNAAQTTPEAQATQEDAQQAADQATPQPQPEHIPGIEEAYGMGIRGADQQAAAESALAKDRTNVLGHQIEAERSLQAKTQEHLEDIMHQSDAFIQDLKDQHINPSHFLDSKSLPSKLATGIGLILGGIGGGLMHQENPALKFLNANIDRDIEAQKANIGNKQNLLMANMHQFGNAKDAADMTRIQMAHMFTDQLEQAAAKQGSPLAMARAQQAKSEIAQHYAPLVQQLALRRATYDLNSGSTPEGQVNNSLNMLRSSGEQGMATAKEFESRHIPGVGTATIPLTPEVRTDIAAKSNLIKASNNLMNFVKNNTISGKLSPSKRAEGEALATELQGLYRKGVGASTSEGEANEIKKIIGANPSQLFEGPYLARLKALSKSQNTSLNTVKSQYGLKTQDAPQKLSPQQQSFVSWAKSNPNNPKAKMVMEKLGIDSE